MAGEAFISTWARCLGLNLEESSAERQRNAEEVEDLRKQLSKAAAEACLHWLAFAISDCVSLAIPEHSRHKPNQALRSQTRSGSGTQKKSKIFENSCPRQLLKLACTSNVSLCGKHYMARMAN